jgi:hypothetical protein
MFNDVASAKAGRIARSNPFARLGISRGPGRRHEQPPSEEQVWKIVRCARELATPSFAGWLQVAAFTGLWPGELDALRRVNVDPARSRIRVVEQFSAATRTFTLPKNGQTREASLTGPAREALVSLPIEGEFCFAPIRGQHWTASARAYHWKAVKAAAGWEGSLYLATPVTSPVGTWSTCSSCPQRMWRSRSATQTAASWCAGCTGTATETVRSIELPPLTAGRQASRRCSSAVAWGCRRKTQIR